MISCNTRASLSNLPMRGDSRQTRMSARLNLKCVVSCVTWSIPAKGTAEDLREQQIQWLVRLQNKDNPSVAERFNSEQFYGNFVKFLYRKVTVYWWSINGDRYFVKY